MFKVLIYVFYFKRKHPSVFTANTNILIIRKQTHQINDGFMSLKKVVLLYSVISCYCIICICCLKREGNNMCNFERIIFNDIMCLENCLL